MAIETTNRPAARNTNRNFWWVVLALIAIAVVAYIAYAAYNGNNYGYGAVNGGVDNTIDTTPTTIPQ